MERAEEAEAWHFDIIVVPTSVTWKQMPQPLLSNFRNIKAIATTGQGSRQRGRKTFWKMLMEMTSK